MAACASPTPTRCAWPRVIPRADCGVGYDRIGMHASGPPPSSLPRAAPLDVLATVVATGLGSGYAPFAPGTAGSLVGLALFWPVSHLPLAGQALVTALVFALGVAAAAHVARRIRIEDP